MVFFDATAVRDNVLGDSTDTSRDDTINAKGAQADGQIVSELYIAANKMGKKQALPAIDANAGTIGGNPVPQIIKDAASDRATGLVFIQDHAYEAAKYYMEASKNAVQSYIIQLSFEEEIFDDNVSGDTPSRTSGGYYGNAIFK